MKVLLIGEASGVHRNLKRGLTILGDECHHVVLNSASHRKDFDDSFAPELGGVLGGVARNIIPYLKIAQLGSFDVVNYVNTITAVNGTYAKYFDLPLIRRKTRIMSYYALGCDEIGLVRRNPGLPYRPCATCLASRDTLSQDCDRHLNPIFERSEDSVRKYFDFGAASMMEYGHVEHLFGRNFRRIPFPVDAETISFVPSQARSVARIIHTPTRRGYKGTDVVLQAIAMLEAERSDFEFRIVEGLSYADYLTAVRQADVVIDQVYSQSVGMNGLEMLATGKIVLTGSTPLGHSYFPFGDESPMFDASPEPPILASTLSAILDRKDEFPELASKGRQYVLDHHDPVTIAREFREGWRSTNRLAEVPSQQTINSE